MDERILADRGRALEGLFFRTEDERAIARLRAKQEEALTRDALAAACGLDDPFVLDALVAHGVSADTAVALSVVPLVEVAWASGHVTASERDAVTKGASAAGVAPGTPSHDLLVRWLDAPPPATLFEAWEAFANELSRVSEHDTVIATRTEIASRARRVARASGGILGVAAISKEEGAVLARIDRAFA